MVVDVPDTCWPALRATGEDPRAARSVGIPAASLQFSSVLFGGFFGGIAGGVLVIAQAGSFAKGCQREEGSLRLRS